MASDPKGLDSDQESLLKKLTLVLENEGAVYKAVVAGDRNEVSWAASKALEEEKQRVLDAMDADFAVIKDQLVSEIMRVANA
jgi:hypothetical protein